MNIFKRLFRIGKAEVAEISDEELGGLLQEADVELDNYRSELAKMKPGSKEAVMLSEKVKKYEVELKTLRARAKVSKATKSINRDL